eukprot:NODE_10360_length_597_cov_3.103376_g10086_i0.p1 GENE.NODE_10360_length_597_cov_3.103376_g10086_i0~~NODE_10360_length_597_cov_3.103376_g10086_i0.p1  ORF type:complete len:166 (-),score=15.95 NODE_10360_length_597_cov_3.103376_g10086_i0:83-580(-)
MNNPNDIGFIHDISSLDTLRQKAVKEGKDGEQEALRAAARQFESIFTSMMLKSMREANEGFESNMMNSQNEKFYRQMLDEQMASELSSSGSMGLADMIVKQLTAGQGNRIEWVHCLVEIADQIQSSAVQSHAIFSGQHDDIPRHYLPHHALPFHSCRYLAQPLIA